MVIHRVNVYSGVIEVWRGWGYELWAGAAKELLKEGKGFRPAALEFYQLVAVLLAEGRVNGVIQLGRVEGDAEGNKSIHLVVLLGDAVVLGVLLKILGPRDVHKDVGEHADGVSVTTHHHVAESYVVVRSEVRSHDTGEHGFLVKLDVIKGFEGEAKVPKQAVNS